jgi:putative copper resistance protein D
VHAHIVIVGCLFLWPLVAVDALPRRLPHPLRLVALLAAVPFHAFLGIALLGATAPMAPDVYPSLADQHAAAGLLWTSGELLTVVATGIVFAQWYRADQRAGRRADAARDVARRISLTT